MPFILIGIIVFVTFATWWGPPSLSHQGFKLFRVLFPSWRFFESITPIPKISYRINKTGLIYSPWQELNLFSEKRRPFNLFYNPSENLRITYQGQIEQLLNDIATTHSCSEAFIQNLTAYKIVLAFIRRRLSEIHPTGFKEFQFKIGALEFCGNDFDKEPLLSDSIISSKYEV